MSKNKGSSKDFKVRKLGLYWPVKPLGLAYLISPQIDLADLGEPDRRLPKHVQCGCGGRGVVGFKDKAENRLQD